MPLTGQAVVNRQFKEISLDDYKGKWLVFFWYPLDFTFVCPTEIIAFSERANEFQALGKVTENHELIVLFVNCRLRSSRCIH